MDLYILRHAIAEERGPAWPDDAERPLTAKGRSKLKQVVRGIAALEIAPAVIISSPFVRARDTAVAAREGLQVSRALVYTDFLTPDQPYAGLLQYLARSHGDVESAMLVGHEPHLTGVISFLLTGDGRIPIELKKAGLALVSVKDLGAPSQTATLRWLMTPRQLIAVD